MIQIYNDDCLKILKNIPDNSIDLILTDPPYGTTACHWDEVINYDVLWHELHRVCPKVILLFGAEPFSTHLRMSNIKNYKYDWIWEKNTGTNFFHAKRMPIRYYENIHVFYKKFSIYNPQKTTGHVPTNSGKGINRGEVYSGKSNVDYKGGDTTRYPKNIIKFDTVSNYSRTHPSEKPVPLLEYLIKTYSSENDTVLDFTMGTGSCGVACVKTNRKFIGIEKEQKYFDIAQKRIKKEQRKLYDG